MADEAEDAHVGPAGGAVAPAKRQGVDPLVGPVVDRHWFERIFYGALALVMLVFAVLAVINNWPREVH